MIRFRNKIFLGIVVTICMIVAISAVALSTISGLQNALSWVEQTHAILDQIVIMHASSEAEVRRVEAELVAGRDLGRPDFVQSREIVQISERLNNLARLTQDSDQLVRLASFTVCFDDYRTGMEAGSKLAAESPNKARAKIESEMRRFEEKALVLLDNLEEAERRLLDERLNRLHQKSRWANFAAAFMLMTLGVAALFTSLTARSHLLFRRDSEKATAGIIGNLERMNRLTEAFQLCSTTTEALRIVHAAISDIARGCSVSISRLNNSKNLLVCESGQGEELKGTFSPDSCCAFRVSKSHFYTGGAYGVACDHFENGAPDQYICAPMLAHGEVIGVIHIAAGRDVVLAEELTRSVEATAEQAALTLCNLVLRERLREQSIRDPLTGLFNRRYMETTLEREIYRSSRHETSVAVMMLDLDHFKAVNDEFGHEAGDQVLRRLAEILKTSTRAEDVACRYGGEEFVVILPGCPLVQAQERAEQIRIAVAAIRVTPQAEKYAACSIGLAVSPQDGTAVDELIKGADLRLYRAKREGRNRVVGPEIATLDMLPAS